MLAEPKRYQARDLDFAFKDTAGVSYFRHTTQTGQSVEHYGKAMEFTMWMAAGLQPTELNILIDLIETANQNCTTRIIKNENVESNTPTNRAIIGWATQEMRLRQTMVIHTELLYNFVACHDIREDEDPFVWIEPIHNEKVEAYKKMVREGSTYDFFLGRQELKNLAGISNFSPDEWNQHWQESEKRQRDMLRKCQYLKSAILSEKDTRIRKKA